MRKDDNDAPQAFDAPQTGPMPKKQKPNATKPLDAPEAPAGLGPTETGSDARDPAEIPEAAKARIPNVPSSDEQNIPREEVLEGVDRAEDDLRRAARIPANQTPPSERE